MPAKKDHPDASFVEDLVERLAPIAAVTPRFMFGGFGLYADGVMFGLVDDGALHLRADEVNRGDFEALGLRRWTYEMRGKPTSLPYYPPPDDALDDLEELRPWVEGAIAAAKRANAAKKPKRAKRA